MDPQKGREVAVRPRAAYWGQTGCLPAGNIRRQRALALLQMSLGELQNHTRRGGQVTSVGNFLLLLPEEPCWVSIGKRDFKPIQPFTAEFQAF